MTGRVRLGVGFAVGLLAAAALAAVGFERGWWWFVHPDRERYPVRGIDVSHHQGDVDWDRVAADDVGFAWLKATEGADFTDPRFAAYRDEAERVGIPWGAYHFFTFCSPPERQAENFLLALGTRWGRLPAAIDLETGGNCGDPPTAFELQRGIARFASLVRARTGRDPVLYVIGEQLPWLFGEDGPPSLPLWYRSLMSEPRPGPGQSIAAWQYHSRAAVDGIDGYADLDVFVGSRAEFDRWLGPDRSR